MQIKICPCCKAKIDFKTFLHGIVKIHKRNPWVENEKGLVCIECKKQVLSAERKTKLLIPIILIAMLPTLGYMVSVNDITSIKNLLMIIFLLLLIIPIGIAGIYRIYKKVELICDDSNSYWYDHEQVF